MSTTTTSPKPTQPAKKGGKKGDKSDDYSLEDLRLKEDLTQHVETIISMKNPKLTTEELEKQKDSILAIIKEMREATASMTAIPKPLKFLREHIPVLREYYASRTTAPAPQQQQTMGDDVIITTTAEDIILPGNDNTPSHIEPWPNQPYIADLLSVISMVIPNETGLVIKYRFDAIQGDYANCDLEDIFKWGISYVQNLSAEIAREYQRIINAESSTASDDENNEKKSNEGSSGDDDDDDDDGDFDDLKPTAMVKTQSSVGGIASTPKLSSTSLSSHKSNTSLNNTSTSSATTASNPTAMGDDDALSTTGKKDDDKKDDDKKDVKSTEEKNGEKKSERDAMGRKKDLSDEEKAKIEAEELRQAKLVPIIPPPSTTATVEDLRTLAIRLLPHLFAHGCEIDAVDMLFELEKIQAIIPFIEEDNYADVLQYVQQSNMYNTENAPEVSALLINLYIKLKQWSFALATALRLTTVASRTRSIAQIFYVTRDIPHAQLSLAYMLVQYTSYNSFLCLDTLDEGVKAELDQVDDVYTAIIEDFPIITDYRAIEVLQSGSCGSLSTKTLQDLGVTKGKTRDDVCRVDDEREDPYEWLAVGFANAGTKIIDVLDSDKAASAAVDDPSRNAANATKTAANLILAKALSTGLIYIGDVEEGYSMVDPYLNPNIEDGSSTAHEQKEQSIIGGVVATALCGASVTNDFNAGLALLSDYVSDSEQFSEQTRITAIQSLGMSYLSTRNEELRELLVPLLLDSEFSDKGRATTAVALGLVFLGSCDITLTELFVAALSEMKESPEAIRLASLACGLLVFKERQIGGEITTLWDTLQEPETGLAPAYISYFGLVCNLCSHIGDGPMELIQELLRSLSAKSKSSEDDDDDDDDDYGEDDDENSDESEDRKDQAKTDKSPSPPSTAAPKPSTTTTTTTPASTKPAAAAPADKSKKVSLQASTKPAKDKTPIGEKETELIIRGLVVLSMAFFSLSDELTQQCIARVLNHLLECGSAEVRAAVPLAMALLNISRPTPGLTDHLVRLTHDVHAPLAINAVLAIGLTAAGSNNSRSLAGISGFVSETFDKGAIQIARIAQGLVMLGQGTLTLSTSLYNNSVLSERSVVALIMIMTQMIEPNFGLCAQLPLWTMLPTCARPKVLVTKLVDNDEPDGEPLDVQIPVKMGQVQGGVILGRKTVLSGVQVTHTPVVIGVGSYVQVDDDDFNAMSHCLQGTVLVNKRQMQ